MVGAAAPPLPCVRPRCRGNQEAAAGRGKPLNMEDVHEGPRPRITTSQLAQHVGQPVCFVGRVQKVPALAGAFRGSRMLRSLGRGLAPPPPHWSQAGGLRRLHTGKTWCRKE